MPRRTSTEPAVAWPITAGDRDAARVDPVGAALDDRQVLGADGLGLGGARRRGGCRGRRRGLGGRVARGGRRSLRRGLAAAGVSSPDAAISAASRAASASALAMGSSPVAGSVIVILRR